jgi:hypothetical protein
MLVRAKQQLHRVHPDPRFIIIRKRKEAASVCGVRLSMKCDTRNNAAMGASKYHLVQLHQRAAAAFSACATDSRGYVTNLFVCDLFVAIDKWENAPLH